MHGFDARDADRGDAPHARRSRRGREGPLHRLLELLRLAPDEVARPVRTLRLGPLCRAPGVLFPGRPRLRMGTDATGRSTRGSAPSFGAPSAGDGSPAKSVAGSHCPTSAAFTTSRSSTSVRRCADEHLYPLVDALDAVARRDRQDRATDRPELAAAATHRLHRHHRCAQRGATAAEPRCGRLEHSPPARWPRLVPPLRRRPAYPYWHQNGLPTRGIHHRYNPPIEGISRHQFIQEQWSCKATT